MWKYILRYISTQKWICMKYLVIEWFGTCQSKINRYASGEGGFRKTCKRSEGIIQRNCGSGVIFQNVYLGKLCSSWPVKGWRKCFITQNMIFIYSPIKRIFPLSLYFATGLLRDLDASASLSVVSPLVWAGGGGKINWGGATLTWSDTAAKLLSNIDLATSGCFSKVPGWAWRGGAFLLNPLVANSWWRHIWTFLDIEKIPVIDLRFNTSLKRNFHMKGSNDQN